MTNNACSRKAYSLLQASKCWIVNSGSFRQTRTYPNRRGRSGRHMECACYDVIPVWEMILPWRRALRKAARGLLLWSLL